MDLTKLLQAPLNRSNDPWLLVTSSQFICLQEGEAEKMGRGGEGIGERKKKSRVAFKHDASGGGGDFCGDGEVTNMPVLLNNIAREGLGERFNDSVQYFVDSLSYFQEFHGDQAGLQEPSSGCFIVQVNRTLKCEEEVRSQKSQLQKSIVVAPSKLLVQTSLSFHFGRIETLQTSLVSCTTSA